MKHSARGRTVALALAAVVVLAAIPFAAAAQLPYTVNADANADYGDILVGDNGFTLYIFTPDEPGVSNCNDGCAAVWPPLLVEEGVTPTGGMELTGDLSVITRDDSTLQVAINDQPLYYYAPDTAPGDATGQGVNDVWYVVDTTGTAITTAPAQAEPTATPEATAEPTAEATAAPVPVAADAGNAGFADVGGLSTVILGLLVLGTIAAVIGGRQIVGRR
jgi:predicted lipoprotein with Yx(FWY)xxD motif